VVGVSAHQVGSLLSHPAAALLCVHGRHGTQHPSGFGGGESPVQPLQGHLRTARQGWAVFSCPCRPAQRWPVWLEVPQRDVQPRGCKPSVLGACRRATTRPFVHVCAVPLDLPSLLHIPADWLLDSRLPNLSFPAWTAELPPPLSPGLICWIRTFHLVY